MIYLIDTFPPLRYDFSILIKDLYIGKKDKPVRIRHGPATVRDDILVKYNDPSQKPAYVMPSNSTVDRVSRDALNWVLRNSCQF